MIDGTSQHINWNQYVSPRFKIKHPKLKKYFSCGTATLGLLTGKNLPFIEKFLPKTKKHWSTRSLSDYLLNNGYTVIQVTKNNVTNVGYWEKQPLNKDHVILINAQLDSREASWFILHNNRLWHNDYEVDDFGPLYFINKPTQDVLLIWHKDWAPVYDNHRRY